MPFPWKKVKSTRISQLVNDHLNISQKRRDGSSLVVETGFPTSLIDLFIKNREKLSKKKRRTPPITSSSDTSFSAPPPSLVGSPTPTPTPTRHSSVLPPPPSCVDEIRSGAVDVVSEEKHVDERGGDLSLALMGVLKIFVVVVLALATKRLAVGVTISAVFLLLLESVGKHCSGLSKPQIARRLLTFKKLEPRSSVSTFTDHEIQAVESNETTAESSSRERVGCEEIELLDMAMKRQDCMPDPKRKSRKCSIKSKVQKIVPKKFRRAKKYEELHTPPILKVGSILCEGKVEQQDIVEESENGRSISDGSSYTVEDDDKICVDRRLSDSVKESDTKVEESAVARTYLPLCLIVLTGLIAGRPFALVLTLSWFLLLKLGQKLPRCIKFNHKSA